MLSNWLKKKNCRMDGKKYWQWLTGSLKEAVQAVREGRISVRRASIEFPVPRAIESTWQNTYALDSKKMCCLSNRKKTRFSTCLEWKRCRLVFPNRQSRKQRFMMASRNDWCASCSSVQLRKKKAGRKWFQKVYGKAISTEPSKSRTHKHCQSTSRCSCGKRTAQVACQVLA